MNRMCGDVKRHVLMLGALGACCVWVGCKTTGSTTTGDNVLAEQEKFKEVVVVEPEGIDLAQVVATHGLHEYESPYAYGTAPQVENMVLYKHRYVELDGEAPAEVILTFIRQTDMDYMKNSPTMPTYIQAIHRVYSFKTSKTGTPIGVLAPDVSNPYVDQNLTLHATDLDRDGRHEIFMSSPQMYYAPFMLYSYDASSGVLRDSVWGVNRTFGFIPFDHDGDDLKEIVTFPAEVAYLDGSDTFYDSYPKDPVMLDDDDQGFWHEQSFRRPYTTWSDALVLDFIQGEFFDPVILSSIVKYHDTKKIAFSDDVYRALDSHYEGLSEPFDKAEFIASRPFKDADAFMDACQSNLDDSMVELELLTGCLSAASRFVENAQVRELVVNAYAMYMERMREYPQLHPKFYSVVALSNMPVLLTSAFEKIKDDGMFFTILNTASQDMDRQTYYQRAGELYPLFNWSYNQNLDEHEFFVNLLFAQLAESIKSGEPVKSRLLMEQVSNQFLSSMHWYRSEVKRAKKAGEEPDAELKKRGEFVASMVEKHLPPTMFEPLIVSSDPFFREIAVLYFSNTDSSRYAQLFMSRALVEQEDSVRNILYGNLYNLTGDKSISASAWKSLITKIMNQSSGTHYYNAYGLLNYFVSSASPAEIIALWDEIKNDEMRSQIIWQVQALQSGGEWNPKVWAPFLDRVLDYFETTSNTNIKSNLMYAHQMFDSERGRKLLMDTATNAQEPYVIQAAFMSLANLGDESALELFKVRREMLREQPYLIYSVLQTFSQKLSKKTVPLLLDELNKLDPSRPLDSQLIWGVMSLMYNDDGTVTADMSKELYQWVSKDLEAGLKIESTSCMRLAQQVVMLFLMDDKDWEKKLELIEKHPDCQSTSSQYMARTQTLNAAIQLSFTKGKKQEKLYSFIRQHHDFPYRPIRLAVFSFEERLKQDAKRKAEAEKKKQKTP